MMHHPLLKKRRHAIQLENAKAFRPIKINALALPKDDNPVCELCSAPGRVVCSACRVTYYCTAEHFVVNMELHRLTCSRLKIIRQPLPFLETTEKRERAMRQNHLLRQELSHMAIKLAENSLEQGKYDMGISASILASQECQALPHLVEDLIKSLLITSECYTHMQRLDVADGFLSRALRLELALTEGLRPIIKAQIRRNEGLTYLAKHRLAEAKASFSEEIYQTTKVYGPAHIRTTPGYCHLADLFYLQNDYAVTLSLIRSIIDIWLNYIRPLINILTQRVYITTVTGEQKVVDTDKFEFEEYDGMMGLKILVRCQTLLNELEHWRSPLDVIRAYYCKAAINYITEKYIEAKIIVKEALALIKSEETRHDLVHAWLQELKKLISKFLYREGLGSVISEVSGEEVDASSEPKGLWKVKSDTPAADSQMPF